MGGWMCVHCGEGYLTGGACMCRAEGRPDTGCQEWRRKQSAPAFDTPPKGAVLAAVIVVCAVVLLIIGAGWVGWLLWGAA